jgi:hypothetical protein
MVADVFAGAFGTLFLLLGVASFFVVVWALIDAAIRPTMAFQAAGQNKVLWIILPIVGLFLFGFIGGIIGLVYLGVIRPKIKSAQIY